jgi:hypothetical protein
MEAVPFLRSGVGSSPANGGCILQIVDWIDRNGWTDRPDCVHPLLRKLAIYVNDHLPNGERQKLLDLTGRLMGTNTGGKELSVRLAMFCARKVLHIYEQKHPGDDRPRRAIEAAERYADDPSEENRLAAAYAARAADADAARAARAAYPVAVAVNAINAAARAADAADAAAHAARAADAATYAAPAAYPIAAASAAYAYQLLIDVLDEYDRLTGRGEQESVDLSPVAAMLELVRA